MQSCAHLIVVETAVSHNQCNWLLAVVLNSLLAVTVVAQYRFDHWTVNDGLPQNTINAITQTRDGYLWFATSDGLARFDGLRFTVFHHGNTEGVEGNRFYSFYEDRDGTLWAGSVGNVVRYRHGQFVTFSVKDGVPDDEIYRIQEDARGRLWLSGFRRQVAQWVDGRFVSYDLSPCLPGRIPDWGIRNGLWWSQDQLGLHFFLSGRWFTVTKQDGLPSLNILSTSQDQFDTLWINTDAGTWQMKDPLGAANHFQSGTAGSEDREGNLWLSNHDFLRRLKDGVYEDFPNPHVVAAIFYKDREGTLWIGSTGGLYRVHKIGITTLTEKEGLYSDLTYSILQDRTGAVWIGSGGGGVSRYRDGVFKHYFSTGPNGLYATNITSLYEDHDGVIWIGTNRGLCQFKDGKLRRYSDEHGLAEVFATYQDHAGDFWFATSSGITRLHNGGFTNYTVQDGLPSKHVTVILEDRNGSLWFGAYGGLALWQNGQFIVRTVADGLSGDRIRSLYEDSNGALWIGTYDSGMTRLKDGRFTRYTTRDGLFGNGVFQIFDDGRGYFWMSSNQGLARVSCQQLNDFAEGKIKSIISTSFGVEDGMGNVECNGERQPAGWKMRDGKLWFPTMGGVAKIDPASIPINPLPPPVVIEECRLNRESKDCRDQLQIEPDEDNLEIQYTANSFIKPEQIRFKYKLIGADPDWIEAGTRRTAFYSHLKPGHYDFTVLAANSDGIWNTIGSTLRIVVKPSFQQTWWFWSLIFLGIAGIAILGYRKRLAMLRWEHELRENFLKRERTAQEHFARQLIASQETERRKITAELHDEIKSDIDLINYAALQGLKQPDLNASIRQEFSEISERASRASYSVAKMIQGLRPQILEAGLTEALISIVAHANNTSETNFIDAVGQVDDVLPKEMETHLYLIVQECAVNIIKHAQATEARVEIHQQANQMFVTIQDNGRGFAPDQIPDSGFGLTSIARRMEILGGAHTIKSAPGQGTVINITIKLPEHPHDL